MVDAEAKLVKGRPAVEQINPGEASRRVSWMDRGLINQQDRRSQRHSHQRDVSIGRRL